MPPSRTLYIGMAVPKDALAVAYVAPDHGAEVIYLGTSGTRPCAIAQLLRQMSSQAQPLLFGAAAGPWGSWLSRSRRNKDDACWVVAPSLLPPKPDDRVTTDRRDAVHRARLARSGARTAVSVPTGAAEARRNLSQAREDTLGDLQDAPFRLKAVCLRPASRSTGRATWRPAHLRGLSDVVCPTPAPHIVLQA